VATLDYFTLEVINIELYGLEPGPTYESTVSYTYDVGNRLTQAVDSVTGTITQGYDNLNRLTSESTPQGTVSYTYDNAGRRATMTVAGQPVVNYSFDNANRLTQITQGTTAVAFGYDTAGRRTTLTLPNGTAMSYSYDTASQLTGLTYALGSSSLGNLAYSYDLAGKRAQVGGSSARTGLPTAVTSATYNAANQLTQWGATTLTYDLNGNLTNDGVNTYTWDARNRLGSISGGVIASFQYDPLGRRTSKTIGGASTQFLYDVASPVQELSGSTPLANLLTGLGVDEVFTRTDAIGARHFLPDALGSTLALTDSSGTLQTQYTYEPFGNASVSGSTNTNSYQFTGRESDGTGLYFYRARYYTPSIGRFLSEDPLRSDARASQYIYARNQPTNLVDPSGLLAELRCERIPSSRGGLKGSVPILAFGALHCYLRVACNGKDETLELYGPIPGGKYGVPAANPFNPGRNFSPPVYPVDPPTGLKCCEFEKRLRDAFDQLKSQLPEYHAYPGPNSNTFVQDVITQAGGSANFPWNGFGIN